MHTSDSLPNVAVGYLVGYTQNKKAGNPLRLLALFMVWVRGFEPPAS
jgi:hypothetical protein